MGQRVRRCKDDDRLARPAHPSLPHPRNRERQLPLQEQLGPSAQNDKGETQELDHHGRHERYLKAGQLSAQIPGQFSAQITSRQSSSRSRIRRGAVRRPFLSRCRKAMLRRHSALPQSTPPHPIYEGPAHGIRSMDVLWSALQFQIWGPYRDEWQPLNGHCHFMGGTHPGPNKGGRHVFQSSSSDRRR